MADTKTAVKHDSDEALKKKQAEAAVEYIQRQHELNQRERLLEQRGRELDEKEAELNTLAAALETLYGGLKEWQYQLVACANQEAAANIVEPEVIAGAIGVLQDLRKKE